MATKRAAAAAPRLDRRRVGKIVAACRSGKVQLVRFLYCGNDSVIRGKAAHVRFLPSYLESGIGLTVAMQSFNMLDQLVPEGTFGPVGEIRLVPDLDTFALLPYAPGSARLLCRMETLERVTAAAFGQRRKMLRQSLRSLGVDPALLTAAAGVPETARAEELEVTAFCAMARALDTAGAATAPPAAP